MIKSGEIYKLIVENVNDLVTVINRNLNIEFINEEGYKKITGYKSDDLIGKDVIEFIHPEDHEKLMIGFDEAIKNGKLSGTLRLKHKDGHFIWAETNGKRFQDKDGITKVITISRDITERKLTEDRLKESEEGYRLISENANDLIRVLNDRFEFEYINENVHKRILGYTIEDLRGKTHLPFLHPEDKRHAIRSTVRNLKKGEGSYQARFKNKKGVYKWFEFAGKVFFTSKGEKKILSIARDINERKVAELKLKESEEKYRLISETAYDLITILNKRFKYEYINESAFEKLLGYSSNEILGLSALKFIHPDDLSHVTKTLFEGFKQGEGGAELRFRHKNGHWVWIEARGKTFSDVDGEIKALIIARDINERKIAELKLKESEEKYRLISETAYDLIGILNKKFKYEYINESAFHKILGYSSNEILGKSALKFIHTDDLSYVTKTLFEGFKQGEGGAELRFRHKNGHWVWIEARGKTFSDVDGEIKALIISRDVTERKKADIKIKDSEEKYRRFVEQSLDGVVLVDENGIIIEWNKAQAKIFGLQREQIIGKYLWDMQFQAIPHHLRNDTLYEDLKESIQDTLKSGKAPWLKRINELNIHNVQGKNLIGQQTRFVIETGKGFMLGSITRDVTKIKEADQKLKESEQKYRIAYNHAQFYKDLFVHDMSNILAVINSSAELIPYYLGESEQSKNIKSITDIIRNQINRGAKLVSNVNTLSELEDHFDPIESIEINNILENSIVFIQSSFTDREIKIQRESKGRILKVNANQLIREVFDNILINAIKYNENSTVEILIKTSMENSNSGKFVKIEFIDNGIGIPDDRKEMIFKRGNRELKGSKGMGIGLSLVKKIIKGYEGKIWIEDKVKNDYTKGSNFILMIPATNYRLKTNNNYLL